MTRLNATATAQPIEEMRQLAGQLSALREKLQAEAPQRAAEIHRIQRELEALQAPEGKFAGSNGSAAAAQETLRLAAEETEGRAIRRAELQLRKDSLRRAQHSIEVSRQTVSESSSSRKRFCPECQTRVQLWQLKCHYCGEHFATNYLIFGIIILSIVAVVLLVLAPSHRF